LIMDIGGGSTEFIIANKNEIFWKQSFQLGVSRLLEKFKPSDPITEENIQEIERFLDQTLEPLFTALNKHGSKTLIGSSGSFDTIAEMIAHKFYSIEILKGKKKYKFQLDDYQWAHQYLLDSDIEKRLSTAGIISMRADMIVLSSIFIQYIITRVKIKKMKLSTYALKEGALDQFFATTS
jgi:exopolyphosphatase / guanosine-5'-triphosphate,3'-diphosphate pyrophosphatase